jgi:cytochrome c oxidase subunit 2
MISRWKHAARGVAFVLSAMALEAPATADEGSRGAELYGFCRQCHMDNGAGNPLYLAPNIAGLPEWYVARQLDKFHSGIRGTSFDDVAGMRMRPVGIWLEKESDRKAVAAYVASLPIVEPAPTLVGGDPERGKALYAPCSACHGPDAKGMEALGAPALDHQDDWYLLTQLEHFKSGIRGSKPQDVQGAQMRPMAMLLADEQAMKDVIAYIMTLGGAPKTAKE